MDSAEFSALEAKEELSDIVSELLGDKEVCAMKHLGKSGEDILMDITEEMSCRFGDAILDAYETTLRELQDYGLAGSIDDVFKQIVDIATM